jgi:predicted nucleic acid-binding protein
VYIESNFVLEIALEQEQCQAANSILSFAERGEIKLLYPSFILSEPFESLMRERRERNALHASLVKSLSNLRRSKPHKQVMLDLEPVISVLKDAHVRQVDLLHSAFERLLEVGECINVDVASFRNALIYQKSLYLSPQDSIIYATMIADLKKQPEEEKKCFLSRDKKAFDNDDDRSIKGELNVYNCRYIGSLVQRLAFIQSIVKAE